MIAEHPLFLSTAPAGRFDRRLALAVVAVSLLFFVAVAPFARRDLPTVWAFIPIYESAIAISDLVTAVILLIQFRILLSNRLLAIACGYLFTALMAVGHALTFPGLFTPTGLLGAGPQSTAWMYMFWHAGFPLAVLCYAVLGDRAAADDRRGPLSQSALPLSIGVVVAAVIGLTSLATAGQAWLPDLLRGGLEGPAVRITVGIELVLTLGAFVLVWRRRPHTVLDLWLMVVLCAWLLDVALTALLNRHRFDVGFYAGRAYGLMAATFVLAVLLAETGALYAKLATSFEAERYERLREAEERRHLFETSLDLILITDRHGTFVRVSPSSLATLGYAPEEMIGHSAAEFIHRGDLDPTREQMRLARRGKELRNFQTRYVHKDGTIVTLDWSGVWSEAEQRYFFIGRDVTEQKRIARMKDEFIATVSHELRTPVTAIAGPLALLNGGAAGALPPSVNRLVTLAHNNSIRLTRLINDILDIDNIESGRTTFDLQRVEIRPLVEQAIEANRALAEQFGVAVRLDVDSIDTAVRSDGQRLTQVLLNLLSNAVKFTPRGKEVEVAIRKLRDCVRIAVHDQGPGIPAEYRDLVFDKFAQVDATDARRKGGTGLGLTIVKETMLRLGGSVGHAAGPSGGTVFHVDVPRWRAALITQLSTRRSLGAA